MCIRLKRRMNIHISALVFARAFKPPHVWERVEGGGSMSMLATIVSPGPTDCAAFEARARASFSYRRARRRVSWEWRSVAVKRTVERVLSMPLEVVRRRERWRMKASVLVEAEERAGLKRARRARLVSGILLGMRCEVG